MTAHRARVHHYVPQWYQKRFMRPGQFEYYYLDLHPDVVEHNGRTYPKRALRHCGPSPCFYKDDLYTLTLGNWSTDEIERRFFGVIDSQGRRAVEVFGDYKGIWEDLHEATRALPRYMDAQRFRTPRGLDHLKVMVDVHDHNQMLLAMGRLYQFHTTMWMEGIWEIVRANESPTKFIVSDEPVTFFNRRAFPSEIRYPEDVALGRVGTRTLFPLSLDACLIITHLQLVRNPWSNPTISRVNARAYQSTMKNLLDTQFGRELEEDEVLRINYILKRCATRYIAAAEEEWLHPERHILTTNWSKLDEDWFLLPHLYKVPFTSEIIMGRNDGSAWAMDEYGRNPGNPSYKDKKLHDREWTTHEQAKREWAKKRASKSVAHVDEFRHDEIYDKIMLEHLAQEGVHPQKTPVAKSQGSAGRG